MECLFGISGSDFCILAADTTVARSIVKMKTKGECKFRHLTPNAVMAYSGEPGDASRFADHVAAAMRLELVKGEGRDLGIDRVSAWTRKTLCDALRSRTPYNVNVLIGGCDGNTKSGTLYWMDYLGSLVKVPFGAHGYGAYFCMGLLDKEWRVGMSEEEAMTLLRKCLNDLKTRFIVALPEFAVRIIRSDGTIEESILVV